MGQFLGRKERLSIQSEDIAIRSTRKLNTGQLAAVELSVKVALYAILLLIMGLVLVGDWSARDSDTEFVLGECYTMVLMGISLVWMLNEVRKTYAKVHSSKRNGGTSLQGFQRGARPHGAEGGSLLVKSLGIFAAFSGLLFVFQIIDDAVGPDRCSSPIAIASSIIKLLFIISQVVLIVYSCSHVTFLKTLPNGMMVLQVLVTNIVIYLWTFIKSKEGVMTLNLSSPPFLNLFAIQNGSSPSNQSQECTASIYNSVFPWLYPFCLEFCLTASAMLAEQWMECPSSRTEVETAGHVVTETCYPLQYHYEIKKEKVNTFGAMIVGVFAFVAHIGVITFLVVQEDAVTATIIWYTCRAMTAVTITVLSVIGRTTLVSCNSKRERSGFELDEVLLVIGSVGSIALAVFRGFPGLVFLLGEDWEYASVVVLSEVVVIAGILCQTAMISMALHREPERRGCISTASIATVVGLLNFSIWLTNTIDVEGLDHHIYHDGTYKKIGELQMKRYGTSSWLLFRLLCFPVAIFYRIHSSVVLYRITKLHGKVAKGEDRDHHDVPY